MSKDEQNLLLASMKSQNMEEEKIEQSETTGEKQANKNQKTWDTEELQKDFEVITFLAPFILVRRKSDGIKGTLRFYDRPRVYFDFVPNNKQ